MPDAAATSVAQTRLSPPAPLAPLTLVLGGARSGKSVYAEALLIGQRSPVYLATAEAHDDEMRARIDLHRRRRGAAWTTIEAPLDLVGALRAQASPDRPVLVDCLTLWLSNLMGAARDIEVEGERLVAQLPGLAGPAILVANEVGLGIVPDNALARQFRDHAGRLNQRLAQLCQRVVFVAAGLPLILKDDSR